MFLYHDLRMKDISIDMLMTAENLKFQKHLSEAMHSGCHEHDA